ncbi:MULTISPECIES: hypothetical protein [unclassified Bradyrhizobium]|uniref:hypothetical protein n=1 Tax=unclassified Bradyrhizobium TaxID=2631580 RepID=UPI0028EF8797|nr:MULTISPECIES: hypothetical protein [unclassified Bradyrhizobium]
MGTQEIFELARKMSLLQGWASEAHCDGLTSLNAIAKTIGVSRNTLVSNLANDKMDKANQERIAKAFGFDTDWAEWFDKDGAGASRKDTADAFIDRFKRHKGRPASIALKASETRTHLDRRFADFRLGPNGSAAGELHANLDIWFAEDGWPMLIEGFSEVVMIGLKRADLIIEHDGSDAIVTAREVKCAPEGGNFSGAADGIAPWWIIRSMNSNDPFLRGRRRPSDDAADCIFSGFQVGNQICARMTARVIDCDIIQMPSQLVEGTDFNSLKVMQQLLKIQALDGVEGVLGEQTLAVVKES